GDEMGRRGAILCALLCLGLFGCKAKSAAETKIPQEEVDRKNPVESNSTSISEGKRLYGATDCALCHGKDGDGKGVLAKDIKMNLHDWRKPESLAHFTDGELSYLILKGKGRMPPPTMAGKLPSRSGRSSITFARCPRFETAPNPR